MSILRIAFVPLAASVHVRAAGGEHVTTTVYVGRHFEVRDHDQPVKYVFNGETRVAHITGSLSSSTRLQRLRLRAGWNSISLAVTATNVIGQLSQFAEALYQWQPASRDYTEVRVGQTIEAGAVLWLLARTNAVVAVTGKYEEPATPSLAPGGGYVASAGLEKWSPPLPVGVTAWKRDAQSGAWRAAFTGDLGGIGDPPPTLAPGEAIYVHSAETAELEPPNPAQRVLYYHPDHLGSSSVITDATGLLAEETAFYPFGAIRHAKRLVDIDARYGFVQKELDAESGLQSIGHRFLDPRLGRWISPDPLLEKGGGRNAYAYVNQSPLKYHDPDGAEITVTKGISKTTGKLTYEIKMQAVLIDASSAKFSQQQIADYTAKLKSTIEHSFTRQKDVKGEPTWKTTVDLRVINSYAEIGDCDHVFRIVDHTDHRSGGSAKVGGKVMDIAAFTLLAPTPDQVDHSNPANKHYTWEYYQSPEGVGAHEFGHSAGLPHNNSRANLMQDGNARMKDNKTIELQDIESIEKAYRAKKLNNPEEANALRKRR